MYNWHYSSVKVLANQREGKETFFSPEFNSSRTYKRLKWHVDGYYTRYIPIVALAHVLLTEAQHSSTTRLSQHNNTSNDARKSEQRLRYFLKSCETKNNVQ